MTAPRPLVVAFVDLVGTTALYERVGDEAAARIARARLDDLAAAVTAAGGTVMQRLGDGLLIIFEDAHDALTALLLMLRRQAEGGYVLRAAAHLGPVLVEDGQLYGDAVNLAARLEQLTRSGELLVSAAFVGALPPGERDRFQAVDDVVVRGRSQPTTVWRLLHGAVTETTVIGQPQRPAVQPLLRLRHAGREVLCDPTSTLLVGREEGCDLVIASPLCSRRHAVIAFRRDCFVIEDRSTNGTWVQADGQPVAVLKRETLPLLGSGTIGLGRSPDLEDEPLGFAIEALTGAAR